MEWICLRCGFVYDEAAGLPGDGIVPGTAWAQVPADWVCPDCNMGKSDFDMVPLKKAGAEMRSAP